MIRAPRAPLLLVLLLLAPALAGCTDDPPPPPAPEQPPPLTIEEFEDPNHYCVVNGHRDRVHAPDLEGSPWRLGQWWTYDLQIGDAAPSTTKLVYYDDQDQGAHYMVGTPTREEALTHALFSTNPMIGRIHAALYSPHESGDHADMFHFPLCSGSTWSTVFFGETFTLTASRTILDLPAPIGASPGFLINGTSAAGSQLTLTYSLPAQWFTLIDLRRSDAEGSQSVLMQLKELGTDYAGEAFFLRGQKDAAMNLGGAVGPANETTILRENGRDGAYDTLGVAIDLTRSGSGDYKVELVDPQGVVALSAAVGDLSGNDTASLLLEIPYQSGNWSIRQTLLPPAVGPIPPSMDVAGQLRLVSIYDRSGTV